MFENVLSTVEKRVKKALSTDFMADKKTRFMKKFNKKGKTEEEIYKQNK